MRPTAQPHFSPGPHARPVWHLEDPDDPDLSLHFQVPRHHRLRLLGWQPLGFLQRRLRKVPIIRLNPHEHGWEVEVVVGLSLVYRLRNRLERLGPVWSSSMDQLLTHLVRAELAPLASGLTPSETSEMPDSPPTHRPEGTQTLRQHFPISLDLL